jgi:hypothetical protein
MNRMPARRAVLTLAVGNPVYLQMAINLARSFRLWNDPVEIGFFLATDLQTPLPSDLGFVNKIDLRPNELGRGFSAKLHLDEIAPAEETLFLDADCLCVGNLTSVFARFRGRDVSVIGRKETTGELFGDIAARCEALKIPWVPRFCGGLYYLRSGPCCRSVFETARALKERYRELNLVPLRGMANEEPLIGAALAAHSQELVPEDGTIKAEPMFFSGETEIDVLKGVARLADVPNKAKPYPTWKLGHEARPLVVHFNCSFAERPPYTREAWRLKKVMKSGWPVWLTTMFAYMAFDVPFHSSRLIKNGLRPIYWKLFGPRRVRQSRRFEGGDP